MTTATITLNPGTGGDKPLVDTLTTVDGVAAPAGASVQFVKVGHGAASDFKTASAANPMPVAGAFFQATQPISGTVAVSNMVTQGLTDTQLRLTAVPVSGTVAVSNMVAQGLTDTQIRATALPVSGAFFQATQPVSGPATDTQLRATPLPVTMSNTLALTDTQLRATPVPVSGALSVTANGIISTVNSTSVALAANGVFTGPAEDITEFADVRLMVFADQPSAVDGLQLQQSTNGTNWDSIDAFTVPATTGRPFSVGASARFFRIVYTNGATAQTAFRLQTKLYKAYGKGASVRPQDARSNENDFEEVLGFGMVYNGVGWDRARGDAINGLRTQMTAVTAVTVLSVANTAATLTLPAPAAGQFHYVTRIRITLHNPTITAVAAAATTLAFTSTNLPGALAWTDGNALAAGTSKTVVDEQLENGIKSSAAATATTITAPLAGAGVQSRITAYFYTGP